MMFAVSRCKGCNRLHGLVIPVSKTTCRWCGKRYDPTKGCIVKMFTSDVEMRRFLQASLSLEAGSGSPIVDDGLGSQIPSRSAPKGARNRTITALEKVLEGGPIAWNDILRIVDEGTEPEFIEECIRELMEEGIIYQMTDGRYALVSLIKPSLHPGTRP